MGRNQGIVRVAAYCKNNQSNMCGSVFSLDLVVESHQNNLLKEVQNHIKDGVEFSEPELLYILSLLNDTVLDMQKHDLVHGDIHPE